MHVLCVGMMVYDVALFPVSRRVFDLEKWDIQPPVISTGGDALNVATTLSKLSVNAAMAGRVGQDANGDAVLEISRAKGVDVSAVVRDAQHGTAVSYMLIEENGERHPLASCEIYDALTADDVPQTLIEAADIVYFGSAFLMPQMDAGGTRDLFVRAKKEGKMTAMDTAMDSFENGAGGMLNTLSGALEYTDIFIPSMSEAQVLTGTDDPLKMARMFRKFGMKVFGVKLGGEGCFLTDFRQAFTIGTFNQFKAVDTTGAGDSFMGAFLCGQLHGWRLAQCGIFANAVASHNVAKVGATAGVPSFKDAAQFAKDNGRQLTITEHTLA